MLRSRARRIRSFWFAVLVGGLTAGVLWVSTVYRTLTSPRLGVTFSRVYAESLGVDPKEAFVAMLTDLHPDHIRFPLYWSSVETSSGVYDFSVDDWYVARAVEAGVPVTMVVGQKVPRWPECFVPSWLKDDDEARKEALIHFVAAAVEHYDGSKAVVRWQVENEPFFPFGTCPAPSLSLLKDEVETVRARSEKPIAMTTSGELEPWFQEVPFADEIGFSLYRLTWNPILGFWAYPLQPGFYRARTAALKTAIDTVYVSELQGEPWFYADPTTFSIEDQHRMFSPRMLRENIRFARLLEVPSVDVWGVEWWWYMKQNGDASLWDEARRVF